MVQVTLHGMSSEDRAAAEVLAPGAIGTLIAALARRGYTVVGPTVRDGAIVLDEIGALEDLPIGWTDAQEAGTYRLARRDDGALFGYAVGPRSARQFFTPPRRTVWSAAASGDNLTIRVPSQDEAPLAFIGLRPCELAAQAIQDRVLGAGAAPDVAYQRRRARAFVVAVNCGAPADTCFCVSMGTGPAVGPPERDGADERGTSADLVVTEVLDGGHRMVVTARTSTGREVLDELAPSPATGTDLEAAQAVTAAAAAHQTRQVDPGDARRVLAANLDHPRWDEVAQRCLSCTNCTLVCPTCFCVAHSDVTTLDGSRADHVQRWDSCFTADHSYLHGVGSVRNDTRSRYRQWLTHKLSTWWDQFDESGCVGCGRCITWCPVGIDLTEEVAAMSEASATQGAMAR